MATGRDTQLTRQVGEYLVAAELGRRGWIATTFTGSLPGFDILAINASGTIIEVQVKAIRSKAWQLNAGQFLDIALEGGLQLVRGTKAIKSATRVCVFVNLKGQGSDEFFIFLWKDLQSILMRDYKGGVRPKNPSSLHHALHPKHIEQFRDNWTALPP